MTEAHCAISRCACVSEQPGLPRDGWYCERLRHDRRVALGPPWCVSSPTQLSFGKPSTTSGHMDLLTVVTQRLGSKECSHRAKQTSTKKLCVTHHNNTTDTNKGDHDHLPFPRPAPDASEAEVI